MNINVFKRSSCAAFNGLVLSLALFCTSSNAFASENVLENFQYCETSCKVDQAVGHALMEKKGAIVIDVRTKEEYDKGHIKDAYLINLSVDQLTNLNLAEHELLKLLKENDTPVLLHCHAGVRANVFMNAMVRDGFKHVMCMGGLKDWKYGLTFDEPSVSFEEAVKNVVPYKAD